MKAVFKKTYTALFFVFLALALAWSGLCIFIIIQNNLTGAGDIIGCALITLISLAFAIIPLLYNRKAYLHIYGKKISGRFGFFKRVECELNDVTFVMPQLETVHIVIKNKNYHILGIKNAYDVSAFIRERIPFSPKVVTEELISDIEKRHKSRKKTVFLVFLMLGLSFVWIFATIFLTGARDIPEFSKTDWIIFSVMWVLEIPTIVAMFVFALSTRKINLPLEKEEYELRRSIFETSPLLIVPMHVSSVFIDVNAFKRITLYDIDENGKKLFLYNIEFLDENYKPVFMYQSENIEYEEFSPITSKLLNITEKFI